MISPGTIQKALALNPLVRVAVLLIAGMVTGFSLSGSPVTHLHLIVAGIFLFGVLLSLLLFRRRYLSGAALLFTVFCLGAAIAVDADRRSRVVLPAYEVEYEGVVLTEPVRHGGGIQCDLVLVGAYSGKKVRASILCDTVTHRYSHLHVGDGLHAYSLLEAIEDGGKRRDSLSSSGGNGAFDYGRWLLTHGYRARTFIYYSNWQKAAVSLSDLSVITRLRLVAMKMRQRLVSVLATKADGDALGVLLAMTLGDKSRLSAEIKDVYSDTAASHVLALSGLHLSIFYGVFVMLFFPFRRRMVTQVLLLLAVWTFVFLVGMSPSVVRSAIMLSMYSLFMIMGRDGSPVNTLALAAILTLIVSPFSLFDIGFQLSYLSVLSILMFSPLFLWSRVESRESRWGGRKSSVAGSALRLGRHVWRWLYGMFAVSVAAQLGTAPLVAYYFGRLSLLFWLSSVIAIPIVTAILWLSFTFFLLWWWPLAQSWTGSLLAVFATFLNNSLSAISSVRFAVIDGLRPTLWQVLAFYVLVVVLYVSWMILRRRQTIKVNL